MKEGFEIKLSDERCIDFFFRALCNGMQYMMGYDISLDCERSSYDAASAKLSNPSHEDVFIQVLKDGGVIQFNDHGGDETVEVNLTMVLERVPKVELDTLLEMLQEQDDACTADIILQTVAYGEVQFG